VQVDVRVVAATHRDLENEIAAGRFREDLYYRLNVLPMVTPPLRERNTDVAELLAFFAKKCANFGKQPIRFKADFLEALQKYPWPGNVRELSNLVDRFSTLFPGQTLHLHTVPACMMPSGMAALQAQRLAKLPGAGTAQLPGALLTGQAVADMPQAKATTPRGDGAGALTDLADAPGPWSQTDPLAHLLASDDSFGSVTVPKSMPALLSASNDEMNDVEEVILLAQGIQTLPPDGISLKQHLIEVERSLIEQALTRTQGNVSQTAKLLQLQRTTLIEKINKYDLRGVA
jgi:sigma-54 specific flagellar transcriptional regulator A